ncbi:MAG: hypothetical protein U9P50_00950 [Patescibacteria group bacterium]|nr:hypothetical protein [Patescibacteria group bacterium]
MQIHWDSDKLKEQLENSEFLISKYDLKVEKKVAQRLIELAEADNYTKVPVSSGKHSIKEGKKFLYFAVDLPSISGKRSKNRLIFEPFGSYDPANQSTITAIKILGIKNYHK